MSNGKRLWEIFWRCTFDRNRRAWRGCYRPVGGVTVEAGHRTLVVIWADWFFAFAFLPQPAVFVRRMHP